MSYINREELLAKIKQVEVERGQNGTLKEMELARSFHEYVEFELPEADPVKHGFWAEKNGDTVCSSCNWIGDPLKMFGKIMWSYCPYCGARMDGGAE